MTTFILIAVAMVLALAALIARPLLSGRPLTPRSPWAALAVLLVLLAGAGGLYAKFSNWNWSQGETQAADGSPESMVSTLARHLASHPEDLHGWLMLGRSYSVLAERAPEMRPLAIRAYEHANQLAKGENVEALQGLAESLVAQDDSELAGRAGELIEKALTLAPQSPKLLFYGAVAAIQRRQLPLARQRFASLLAESPPENVRNISQQQINAIDQALGAAGPGADNKASAQAASAVPARVRITITLAPKVKSSGKADAPLFVFVRDPRAAGPPLAVKRLAAHCPQTVELSSSDAMLAGHGMQVGQDVEIVARISSSGSPLARSGDPFGAVAYHVGATGSVNVDIDRLTP
jgi:cytochrome c-type biogenesis protein CcmH